VVAAASLVVRFRRARGNERQQLRWVALATVVVAALFQPARRRIQAVVDRRFNRRKYHAAQTIQSFSTRLRDQIDLDTLSAELLSGLCLEAVQASNQLSDGPLDGGGERAEDAELVAFWVGEHHPGHLALTYVGTAGAQPEQPLHLRLVRAVNWPQVQVQAVLDRLGF
jgi:hypothetical protein